MQSFFFYLIPAEIMVRPHVYNYLPAMKNGQAFDFIIPMYGIYYFHWLLIITNTAMDACKHIIELQKIHKG